MKKLLVAALVLFMAFGVFAQSSLADADPEMLGVDAARQALREVSLDLFEREGSWDVAMSIMT